MRSSSVAVLVVVVVIVSSVSTWCLSPKQGEGEEREGLAQFGALDDLMSGDLDGKWSVGDVLSNGDFGLGTFDALDGEMVVYGGVCYQVTADGVVRVKESNGTTPFAEVAWFHPSSSLAVSGDLNLTTLEEELKGDLADPGIFYAIELKATFSEMVVRSVPRQSEPYLPLPEIIKNQTVFHYANVSGMLVGIWSPSYAGSVSPQGFHFHFLSDDKAMGGHVLGASLSSGMVRIDPLERLQLVMAPMVLW